MSARKRSSAAASAGTATAITGSARRSPAPALVRTKPLVKSQQFELSRTATADAAEADDHEDAAAAVDSDDDETDAALDAAMARAEDENSNEDDDDDDDRAAGSGDLDDDESSIDEDSEDSDGDDDFDGVEFDDDDDDDDDGDDDGGNGNNRSDDHDDGGDESPNAARVSSSSSSSSRSSSSSLRVASKSASGSGIGGARVVDAEAHAAAVRAAQSTMKRAHMGKAGRVLIRKQGDAPAGVNWAENSDSSEDEHENRIGNVPLEWYAEHDHIGYRADGSKMIRKSQQDELDRFLASIDDPNARRTVYDEINDRHVVISDEEMRIIQRMRHGKLPGAEFDAFAEFGNWFSSDKALHPFGNPIRPKASFVPSKHEGRMVYKLVNAIRNGWIKLGEHDDEHESAEATAAKRMQALYLMWSDDGQATDRNRHAPPPITAPKPKLPGHAESYNPPAEYLPTEEELSAWENMDAEDRPLNFVPQQFDAMRKIPLYADTLKERFERCLDLYLCPRARRKRLTIDPDSLLPKLPKPAELRPFPTAVAIEYRGHAAAVRVLSVSPSGQWLASGSADGEVRMWEVETGRCVAQWTLTIAAGDDEDGIAAIAFNPNVELPLLAVAATSKVLIYHTELGSDEQNAAARAFLSNGASSAASSSSAADVDKQHARWTAGANLQIRTSAAVAAANSKAPKKATSTIGATDYTDEPIVDDSLSSIQRMQRMPRCCAVIDIRKRIRKSGLTWHAKGDYLCSVSIENAASAVLIHRLSRHQTQTPFAKSKGLVQCVLFHPEKPFLFVATQQHVRVYNLVQQNLLKKLQCAVQRIASLALHPGGDNLIVGSEDRRVCWFDMDLSTKPYKTIKYHKGAVNGVAFHRSYPLFCSASSDGAVHVFHATVYADLLQNPLVVPVKVLPAHASGVLDCTFHPSQPWVFTAGNDSMLKLFQ